MSLITKRLAAGFIVLATLNAPTRADYWWDTVAGNGRVDGGTGTWDSGSNWTANGGTNNVSWSNGQIVRLQAAPGTVTIGGTVSPANVKAHTSGYVITGGAISFASHNYFQPDAGVDLRVESAVSKGAGLNLGFSGGRTILAGNNTGIGTGYLNMDGGTLRLAHDNAAGSGTLLFNGGRLEAEGTRTYANDIVGSPIRFGGTGNLTLTANFGFGTGSVTFENNDTGLPLLGGKVSGGDALADNININSGRIGMTNAANDYTGTVQLPAVFFTGNNAAGLSPNANLRFSGGVIESSGTFNRTLGSGAAQVQWSSGFSGGFAGCGGKLTVDLETSGTRDTLTWAGFFVPAGPGTLTFGSSTADNEVEFLDNLDMQGNARTITVNDNVNSTADKAVISGVISGNAGIGIGKAGLGLLVLAGTNTYPGVTILSKGCLRAEFGAGIPNATYLQFGNSVFTDPAIWESSGTQTRAIQNTAGSVFWNGSHGGFAAVGAPFTLNLESVGYTLDWGGQWDGFQGTVLQLNSPNATDVVTINNNINLKGDRTVIVFDNVFTNSDKAVLAGVLANGDASARSFTKAGPGLLELAGASTYSGTTTVTGGTLRVNGSLGAGGGTVTLWPAAALGGTGTISRAVTVLSGGILAPGTSVGTLNVAGNVSLSNAFAYAWEHDGTSGDTMAVTGDLYLPTNAVIACTNILGGTDFLAVGTLFTFTTASGASDLSGWTLVGAPAKYQARIAGNSVVLKPNVKGTLLLVR